ncbi:exodeoxyribonuclease V subunit alpha [Tsukamurella sp. 8F]|uniref:exodeoxyribonuclease V subunit alpha n=1 Tax=unclassified Tsukamurella TaxID=2633480 RepID=UPI0023B92F4E|nr:MULTISPECIES: exodeoxyribonuclease V subunit alpha [unclassified Tsukamurella]MDF0532302.1 exodeoxyribonuclease V subunit alpha [Tsukamurella sp. 8J]MDF0588995.1 exodeoxyribonuclease V subunit alpha [Tsukamurella sp. 8F]
MTLLDTFADAGVLASADTHVARAMGRLGGETDESVLLAAALATRAVRQGSVCIELSRMREVGVDSGGEVDVYALPWPDLAEVLAALERSPLIVGSPAGPLRPLHLSGDLLYLDRYYRQEEAVREILDNRAGPAPGVDADRLAEGLRRFFPEPGTDRQRVAAAVAVLSATSVIAGGPGTGKTHTVARILALLFDQHGPELRVGLAAPTGRASAQLQDAVATQADALGLPRTLAAQTIHRMLGFKPGSASRFRHDADNHLPYDVVIVDETSMVSLTIMCRLVEAMRSDARLILVGDPDQLASVDAGAVLADLVSRTVVRAPSPALDGLLAQEGAGGAEPALSLDEVAAARGGVVRLLRGRRFGGMLGGLADAVRGGDADEVMRLLRDGGDEIEWCAADDLRGVRADVMSAAEETTRLATAGDAFGALSAVRRHRLLCAHSDGASGVQRWGRLAEEWIGVTRGDRDWYAGQPLLVTANDYDARVYNGDVGVVVAPSGVPQSDRFRSGGENPFLRAAFARGTGVALLYPNQLVSVRSVYAMTIHRSQGSQYDAVSVVIPPVDSRLLTRELLYTAITRARSRVRLIGEEAAIRAGVERRVLRASGLRTR